MKQLLLYLLLVVALAWNGCENNEFGSNRQCLEPLGPIVSETRSVGDFEGIRLIGVGNILLTQGSPQELRIVSHQNILDILSTDVIGETLEIDFDRCTTGNIVQLDIHITIPHIQQVQLQGVGNVAAQNDFTLSKLEVDLLGVGDITLEGTSDTLEIISSGVGNIHAFDMATDICEVLISGVGNAEVTVETALNVTISGAGSVFYKGSPTIDANISGNGNLINAN